jgi:hypothetical protein
MNTMTATVPAKSYTTATVHLGIPRTEAGPNHGQGAVTVLVQACGMSRRQLASLYAVPEAEVTCKRCQALR